MDFSNPKTIAELAKALNKACFGDVNQTITGLNEIHRIKTGELVFVDHPKYYDKALTSAANCILINQEVEVPAGKGIIVSDDPFRDFNELINQHSLFISAQANISSTAIIGKNTVVQPNVFIGENVTIGNNCIVHANVVLQANTVLGNNVIVHANTTLGGDAFYYKKRPSGYDRLISCGKVVVENDVEIGSNCTIDRGVTDATIIGEGSKLDNLIQIGHDTVIGKQCLIASQVGIAGCVVVEDNVTIWGQVGVGSGLTIGKNAVVLGKTGVTKSIGPDKTYFGLPVDEARNKFKEIAAIRKLAKGL
jgi:UDP-3-O-[3-hydroxymyristoyl] glucosamine N-acyltransferase